MYALLIIAAITGAVQLWLLVVLAIVVVVCWWLLFELVDIDIVQYSTVQYQWKYQCL